VGKRWERMEERKMPGDDEGPKSQICRQQSASSLGKTWAGGYTFRVVSENTRELI
jgi:hypothetical protein